MRNLFLGCAFLFNAADIGALDPFLAKDTFSTAFVPGETVRFERKSCFGRICDKSKLIYFIESVRNSEASVLTKSMDGTILSEDKVAEAVWNENHHSLARQRIKIMESYGFRVEVQSIVTSTATIVRDGKTTAIDTRIVTLSAANGAGMQIQVTLEIAAGLGGPAQILRWVEDRGSSSEALEVQDVQFSDANSI